MFGPDAKLKKQAKFLERAQAEYSAGNSAKAAKYQQKADLAGRQANESLRRKEGKEIGRANKEMRKGDYRDAQEHQLEAAEARNQRLAQQQYGPQAGYAAGHHHHGRQPVAGGYHPGSYGGGYGAADPYYAAPDPYYGPGYATAGPPLGGPPIAPPVAAPVDPYYGGFGNSFVDPYPADPFYGFPTSMSPPPLSGTGYTPLGGFAGTRQLGAPSFF